MDAGLPVRALTHGSDRAAMLPANVELLAGDLTVSESLDAGLLDARPAVDMLLAARGATMGRPAFITSTVSDILGSASQSFRRWVADHPTAFTEGQERHG
jgi:hypothetical protein